MFSVNCRKQGHLLFAKDFSLKACNRRYFNSVLMDFTEMLNRATILALGDENVKNGATILALGDENVRNRATILALCT